MSFTLPAASAPPRGRTMFLRALGRRCPMCGGGPIFTRWLKMVHRCPRCGLVFGRGEHGYALGAVWFNLLFAEAVSVAVLMFVLFRTWPDPPWATLQVMAPIEALATPFLFYPFSKTLFLTFDLCLRPPAPADYTET